MSVMDRRHRLLFSVGQRCYFLKKQDVIPRGLPLGKVNSNILWLMFIINFGCGLSFKHLYGVNLNCCGSELDKVMTWTMHSLCFPKHMLAKQCTWELGNPILTNTVTSTPWKNKNRTRSLFVFKQICFQLESLFHHSCNQMTKYTGIEQNHPSKQVSVELHSVTEARGASK